jgi:hypothetical protein
MLDYAHIFFKGDESGGDWEAQVFPLHAIL